MKGIQLWHNLSESWFAEADLDPLQLTKDQVLVRALNSMVSTGTERLVLSAQLDPVTSDRMSFPLMQGSFDSNFTYGYSLTGIVEHGPEAMLGQHVHLLHPHQSYALVSSEEVTVIPAHLAEKAVLVSNLETAVNAIWDAQVSLGDEVLVIGYGIIGALLVQVLRDIPGVTVRVHDVDQGKMNLASAYETGEPKMAYDIVFHTSGSAEGLQFGIDQLKKEGTLIELSWYGPRKVEVSLGQSFHYDRKRIISSQVSSIPQSKAQRWDYAKRKQLVISLLDSIDFDHLIQNRIPFSEAIGFFERLRKGEIKELGTIINYK